MNLKYDWGREEPKPGFYIALKKDDIGEKISPVVVSCEKICGNIGWGGYCGPKHHVSAGNPAVQKFEDNFIVWARLPDPM